MSTNEQKNELSRRSEESLNPFKLISKPKIEVDVSTINRKLEDKNFEALGDIKYNGNLIKKGSIFKLNDQNLVEHFINFKAIKEVL